MIIKAERGAALVEAALIAPLLSLLVVGMIGGCLLFYYMMSNIVTAGIGMANSFAYLDPNLTATSGRIALTGAQYVVPATRPSAERTVIGNLIENNHFFDYTGNSWQRLIANSIGGLVANTPNTQFMASPNSFSQRSVNLNMQTISAPYSTQKKFVRATLTNLSTIGASLRPTVKVRIPSSVREIPIGIRPLSEIGVISESPLSQFDGASVIIPQDDPG